MPVLGWVGIGCGALLVFGIVVMVLLVGWCKRTIGDPAEFMKNPEKAAAEMIVRLNPDLKLVSQNEAKGEMTIRTKDGQEMTLSYKDISQGKFSVKDAKGKVTETGGADLSILPPWVPRAPALKGTQATFQNAQGGGLSGSYTGVSSESLDALDTFFKDAAANTQLPETSRTSINTDGNQNRIIAYEADGKKLHVILSGKAGGDTRVQVSYEEK